jgi:hypothetical protein
VRLPAIFRAATFWNTGHLHELSTVGQLSPTITKEMFMKPLIIAAFAASVGFAMPAAAQAPRDSGQTSPLAQKDSGQSSPLAKDTGQSSPLAKDAGKESPLAKDPAKDSPLATSKPDDSPLAKKDKK